jgi:hypothetical protein
VGSPSRRFGRLTIIALVILTACPVASAEELEPAIDRGVA